jgi:hypothetical protein
VRRARRRDDDYDDEEEAPRPRKKKKKRRKQSSGVPGGGMGITLIAVAGVCLVCVVLAFFVPALAIVPVGLGYLTMFGGSIWLLVIAFQDSVGQGLLCLFIPFYSLIYVITHWDETKTAFLVQLAGFGLVFLGGFAGGLAAMRH